VIFYTPFRNMPASISADEQFRLRAQGVEAIRKSVIPAHMELLKFIQTEYIPGARTNLAAESLPDGKAYYQSKILENTTTHLSSAQIHQIGLDELAKIHQEMVATMKQTGFQGNFPAFLHFLRTDPRFYAKTPQELLMQAAFIAKEFDGKASQYFGYLPRMRFAILPVPAAEAPFYTSARGGPGTYLVNTYDLPSRGLYSLPALTLHESAPGHAFQIPINMEQKNLPAFRQVYIDAYGEGWALYCERLGTEMGMYHTPYESFGMLSYQRGALPGWWWIPASTSQGWTREQAQQFLRENTALSDHEIQTEVDRYIRGRPRRSRTTWARWRFGKRGIRRKRRWGASSISAPFTTRCWLWALYLYRCWRTGLISLLRRVGRDLIRRWSNGSRRGKGPRPLKPKSFWNARRLIADRRNRRSLHYAALRSG